MRQCWNIMQPGHRELRTWDIRVLSHLCPDYIERVNGYTRKESARNRFTSRSDQSREWKTLVIEHGGSTFRMRNSDPMQTLRSTSHLSQRWLRSTGADHYCRFQWRTETLCRQHEKQKRVPSGSAQ